MSGCMDTRDLYAHDYDQALAMLNDTGNLVNAQEYLEYWDRVTDRVYTWSRKSGIPFESWINSFGTEAVICWERNAQTCANFVRWNGNVWGNFGFNPRGQFITWPGPSGSAYIDDKWVEVWQVPRYEVGVTQIGPEGHIGQFRCWWYHG